MGGFDMETSQTTEIADIKQKEQLREWASQIEAQQSSGSTASKWCADNGVAPKIF